MLATTWRATGRQLGARYAANRAAYAAAGYGDPAAYRLQFVAANWPRVSSTVKRYIREGFQGEVA